jgi:hypothetical protein
MSKRIVFGIPIIFIGLGVLGWLAWSSDEEQIEALFEELSEVASKTEDASTLSDAMVVKDFKKLFAPKVVISIRSKARIAGEHTNQGLAQLYGRLRVASRRMELRCEELQKISLGDGLAVYSVKFYAGWTGKGGNVVRENAHSRVELSKVDGDWKVSQIDYLKK